MMAGQFIDHTAEVQARVRENVAAALEGMGAAAAGMIVGQMETGYGRPIRRTGALMADVGYDTDGQGEVRVGNSLDYATAVHEGGPGPGRPYIRDALNGGADALREIAEEALRQGF